MTCERCATSLRPGARFCPGCGAPVGAAGAAPRPAPAPAVGAPGPAPSGVRRRAAAGNARRLLGAVAGLALLAAAVYGYRTWPGGSSAAPAGCGDEASLRSVAGGGEMMLAFSNRRSESIVVHWINTSGARERWFEVRPGGSRNQRTLTTHRWVVARPSGECLQVVSTAGAVVVE